MAWAGHHVPVQVEAIYPSLSHEALVAADLMMGCGRGDPESCRRGAQWKEIWMDLDLFGKMKETHELGLSCFFFSSFSEIINQCQHEECQRGAKRCFLQSLVF